MALSSRYGAVTAWFRDDIMRRLTRNVGYLLGGSGGAALLALISLALTARALGPTLLGVLVLIETYVRLVDQLVRLETWQSVIKYGADCLENDRPDDFKRLIKFSTAIDACGAVFAGMVAAGGVYLFGYLMGWSDDVQVMGIVYSLTIMARLSSTPTAVMRLFDRFSILAFQHVLTAGLRLSLVTIAFLAGAGLWGFLLVSIACILFQHAIVVSMAWRELVRRGYGDALMSPLPGVTKRFPAIWQFIWSMNLSVLIRKTTREADTLIIGGVLGPTSAGLYHIAKRLGDAILKLGTPIQQAIYPEVAKLWARNEIERFKKTVWRINLATGVVSMLVFAVLALNMELLIKVIAGDQFLDATLVAILQVLGVSLTMFGIVIRPALQSMGLQYQLLKIVVVATAVFYVFLFLSIDKLGIISASLAHIAFAIVWLAATVFVLLRALNRTQATDQRE